ncbi:MAG: hypothetical protein V3V01_00180 [Acidimicrobiales bacterium]
MTDIDTYPAVTAEDLQAVASDVLMALLGPELMWELTEPLEPQSLAATIEILATANPTVVLAAEAPVVQLLATAFFGAEEASDPSCWPDALLELSNVMAGSLKPLLAQGAILGLPTLSTWPPVEGIQVSLRSEIGGFALALSISNP